MRRWFRKHRGWSAILAFGVLFLVAFFVYRSLFAAGTVQEVQYVTQAAENGTLIVSVSGTGNAELGSSYDVTPSISGVVRGLNVKVGDTVTEGQVLFTLENDQLDVNVISAQASFDQARASLLNAEANVYQSEQSLDQLQDAADNGGSSGATTTPTTRPPTNLPSTTLPPATYPSTTSSTIPPAGTTSTSSPPATVPTTITTTTTPTTAATTTTATTTTTTEPAITTTTGMSPPPTDVSAAGAAPSVSALGTADGAGTETATSVAALAAPETGGATGSSTVTATDIAVAKKKLAAAEASLAAAQGSLQTAEYSLERARIDAAARTVTAPAAGVITALNVAEGVALGSTSSGTAAGASGGAGGAASSSSSSTSGAALTIVDPRSISVVVQLMESDIPQIEVGQKATLTFDAVPDLTLAGKVSAMDLIGTNTQGVVTFNVTVTPDSPDERIRAGMTSYASIVTAVRQDVLLVPSSAVKTATGGGAYVEVVANGAPEQRNVTVGLSGDTQIEIASGLQVGDEVVTQTIDPNTTQTTARSGGLGIGGGFPGAGGPGR